MKARDQKQPQQQKPAPEARKADGDEAVLMLPLNQLHPWAGNVRKTGGQSVEALAASIAAQGLIHNLTVIEVKAGKSPRYEVVAGSRRLAAHKLLAKQKVFKATHPVRCEIVSEARAKEISLAENVVREAMHPADQFQAFAELVEAGKDAEEIGARFGVTAETVKRRLAMAAVSPAVLAAYREDRINLEQVMAFTLTADHAKQDALLAERWIPGAHEIRRRLTDEAVGMKDRRAVFVGADAYEAAGGAMRRDLFAEDGEGVYFEDVPLLERLAVEKLDDTAESLREAWAWVEVRTEFDYTERSAFGRVPTVQREATQNEAERLAELEKTLTTLRAEETALEAQFDDDSEEDNAQWEALANKIEDVETAIAAIEDARNVPAPGAAEFAGAVVTLDWHGAVEVHAGLVRPEDKQHVKRTAQAGDAAGTSEAAQAGSADPLAVRMNLSAFRTAVVQDALAANPGVALRALAFAMAQSLLMFGHEDHGLNVRASDKAHGLDELAPELASAPAHARMGERATHWESTLPDDSAALWAWCLSADDSTIGELLAYCTARTIDGVQRFPNSTDTLAPMAEALGIDMADHWQPEGSYFRRIKKADTLAALDAAGRGDVELKKLKRDALADEAAARLAGTRWLPPTFRAAA